MNKIKEFFKKIIRVIVRTAIRIYFAIVYRVKVVGTENIQKDNYVEIVDIELVEVKDDHYKRM